MSFFDKLLHRDNQKDGPQVPNKEVHAHPPAPGGSAGTSENDPGRGGSWIQRGQNQWSVGESDKALESFEKGLEIEPGNTELLVFRGLALGNLGRYQEAIASFDKALDSDPGNMNAAINRGIALGAAGNHKDALVVFDQAIAANSKNSLAWYNKGVALQVLGNEKDADAAYENAFACCPDLPVIPYNILTMLNKSAILEKTGRYEDALLPLNQVLSINPQCIEARIRKGRTFRKQGRYQVALDVFEHLKKESLHNPALIEELRITLIGYGKIGYGKREDTIWPFEKTIELNQKSPDSWCGMGDLLARQAKFNDALTAFKTAEKIDPENIPVLTSLADLYQKMGAGNLAIEAYD